MALIVVGGGMRLHERIIAYLLVFMCMRTSKSWFLLNLSPLYKVTSKNVSSVSFDSYMNLIVGCIWLMLVL